MDLSPTDADIPTILLSEGYNCTSIAKEEQYLSSLDLIKLQTPTEHEEDIEQMDLPHYQIPDPQMSKFDNQYCTCERESLCPLDQDCIVRTHVSPFNEIYAFPKKPPSRSWNTTKSVHESLEFLEQKLEKLARIQPGHHKSVLLTMAELCGQYIGQKDFWLAEKLHEKVVCAMKQIYGCDDHPKALSARLDVIGDLQGQSSWKKAEMAHCHIHNTILTKHLENHELVSKSTLLLSDHAYHAGRIEEAEHLRRQALQINLNLHGPKHKDTLKAMRMLGKSLKANESFEPAERLLRITTQLHDHVPGLTGQDIRRDFRILATCLAPQGMFQQAKDLLNHASSHAKSSLPNNHPQVFSIMHDSAHILALEGSLLESANIWRDLIAKDHEMGNRKHKHSYKFSYKWRLGQTLYALGAFEEASHWLEKALDGSISTYGIECPRSLMYCYKLGSCYQKLGKYREALELFQNTEWKIRMVDKNVQPQLLELESKITEAEYFLAENGTNWKEMYEGEVEMC